MNDPSLKSRFIPRVISLLPLCLSVALIGTQSAKALTITPTSDGKTLVDTITGPGITVDPLLPIEFIGAEGSTGTFTNGISSGIGIESGIILTTGKAVDAVGPNSEEPFPGTPTGGQNTSSLKFQFKSTGGDVFLKYAFASEEYFFFNGLVQDGLGGIPDALLNNFPSDLLSIFVDGENIALIPETNIPVSVSTVNPIRASEFYNNNDPITGGSFNIQYDGFTNVFTARVSGLAPGSHELELFIDDDAGDGSFDSALFVAAGSLTADAPTIRLTADDPTSVPEPTSILGLLGIIFIGSTIVSQRK